jgi:hypothetical protein
MVQLNSVTMGASGRFASLRFSFLHKTQRQPLRYEPMQVIGRATV